jgi:hypothetical protein
MNEVSINNIAAIDNDNIITEDDVVRFDVDEADYDNFEYFQDDDNKKRQHDEAFPEEKEYEGGKKEKIEN